MPKAPCPTVSSRTSGPHTPDVVIGSGEGAAGFLSQRPMRVDDRRQSAELRDHRWLSAAAPGGHDAFPVDGLAIADVVRETDEPGFVRVVSHGAWIQPAAAAPD